MLAAERAPTVGVRVREDLLEIARMPPGCSPRWIVEQNHRPVAVIRTPNRSGRPISEILRQAKERNSTVTLDPDFGKDLEAIIASRQQP